MSSAKTDSGPGAKPARDGDPFDAVALLGPAGLEAIMDGLTDAERAKVQAVVERARSRAAGPRMKLGMDGSTTEVKYAHPNPEAAAMLLMADLGTCDPDFHAGVTTQVVSLGGPWRQLDEENSNFVLSVVRAVQPRDELESMLAVQMGAIHAATMMMARRLNHVETIPQQDAAERALNKLARTFTSQMDTLKRYRTGGQQRVVVEHVTVNEGGQAIVGPVATGGRGDVER